MNSAFCQFNPGYQPSVTRPACKHRRSCGCNAIQAYKPLIIICFAGFGIQGLQQCKECNANRKGRSLVTHYTSTVDWQPSEATVGQYQPVPKKDVSRCDSNFCLSSSCGRETVTSG